MSKVAEGMNREIVTDPLGVEDLKQDLAANIDLLMAAGFSDALVFFGFAWGKHLYENQWHDMPMSLDKLQACIMDAEKKGFGRLGLDNLYITIKAIAIRLHYSYETDIHLSYAEENEIVNKIRARWLSLGWMTESLKSKTYNR